MFIEVCYLNAHCSLINLDFHHHHPTFLQPPYFCHLAVINSTFLVFIPPITFLLINDHNSNQIKSIIMTKLVKTHKDLRDSLGGKVVKEVGKTINNLDRGDSP